MRALWLGLALLSGCDDTLFGVPIAGTEVPLEGGFCGVQTVLARRCAGCHSAAAPDGGLDLQTDPIASLVGQAADIDPSMVRVVPGDPDASLLIAKLEGTQDPDQGGSMPPGSALDADTLAAFRSWVLEGATGEAGDCGGDTDLPQTSYYPHPEGWAQASAHGQAFKLREPGFVDFCTTCHGGEPLAGGTGPSCDTCHEGGDAWRSDCTFCHGDPEDGTGAPPRDIDGATDTISFAPHRTHVQPGPLHPGWSCSECHDTPTDVGSSGHVFVDDATAGVAEVIFSGGRAEAAVWTSSGASCSDVYCHGSGRGDDGSVAVGDGPMACDSCHPGPRSGESAWDRMSGEHDKHLRDAGATCQDCHPATTADGASIADVGVHIDGLVQTELPGITRTGLTCSGSCHGEVHDRRDWR